MGKPDDPLAGLERILYCSVHACEFGTCGGGEEHQKVRLLPEPAVRKAIGDHLREWARDARKRFSKALPMNYLPPCERQLIEEIEEMAYGYNDEREKTDSV